DADGEVLAAQQPVRAEARDLPAGMASPARPCRTGPAMSPRPRAARTGAGTLLVPGGGTTGSAAQEPGASYASPAAAARSTSPAVSSGTIRLTTMPVAAADIAVAAAVALSGRSQTIYASSAPRAK